ncbi:SET domain protein [Fusarium beomiforme]|uniref:SET domain protein n=1 Tax=Fusarium beomiforme TaxID=44412 RepID=A0A9P5AGL8_9HYPO|nr:SET domain protein [Fusarium beomiforme]
MELFPTYLRYKSITNESPKEDASHSMTSLRPSRKRQGGLRPDLATSLPKNSAESPRQMQVGQENFPKTARLKPDGVFYPRESSLGKFIVGVWEQIHSGLVLQPHVLTQQLRLKASLSTHTHEAPVTNMPANRGLTSLTENTSDSFTRGNVLCQRVTQASRTCRSIEVIVQARWVELFDSYVENLSNMTPGLSLTKSRMRALAEACSDFGWSEKEL